MTLLNSNQSIIESIASHLAHVKETQAAAELAIEPLLTTLINNNPNLTLVQISALASVPVATVNMVNRKFCGRRTGAASPSHPFQRAKAILAEREGL
jgi:hypothetical protein